MRWDHTIFQEFFKDHYKIPGIYPRQSKFNEYSTRVIITGVFQEHKTPVSDILSHSHDTSDVSVPLANSKSPIIGI